ncbi:glycoside hydrolase family 92 protein, partial [Brevibacillus sp. SIMBA_076]
EDNGEMSAWLVLSSLGMYPLMPGAEFVLTTPMLPRMRLRRPVGDLVVEARGDP